MTTPVTPSAGAWSAGRRRTATVVVVALIAFTALTSISAQAADTVPFLVRYTTNANGAIVTIGNNLLTCPAAAENCAAARAGGNYNNNSFTMTHLDADDVAGTFNSSSSVLSLPEGATVLWAGLYWGARLQTGTGGQTGSGTRTVMQLRPPGAASYQTITSQQEFGPNTASYNAYQEFADVTAIVRAAGNGEYWGANVVTATGVDRYAGWSLTVAYAAPGMPLRNLTVFDGFDKVGNGEPQTVTVSGFRAPLVGPVDAQLSMVAYEGDLSSAGDQTRLNSTQLATALSPGSNFFNSTNDRNGTLVTTRTPADQNMLGFDIKNLGASGAIPNGATSATFTFSSSGDVYYPGLLTTAINLYAPDFTASSKSVVNLDGNSPARPGDRLLYSVSVVNTGQDPATQVVSHDVLPPGLTYVPGSLELIPSPGAPSTALTDAPGDDAGEYLIGSRTVQVRLGVSATATTGGTVAVGAAPRYTFQVTVDPAAGDTTVTNSADVSYRTGTTDIPATYTVPPASVDVVAQADLSVTKTLDPRPTAAVGSGITGLITVTNHGPDTARNVRLTDPVPAGWDGVGASLPPGTPGWCTVTSGTVVCSLGDMADGATTVITVTGTTAPDSTATSLTNTATVSTTSYDPSPTNNVASDTIVLDRAADLAVTKTAATSARPGDTVTWTLTVTNAGPSDAANLLVTDRLDDAAQAGLTAATIVGGQGPDCPPPTDRAVRCTIDRLPAGTSATVTVRGRLAADLTAGTSVGNSATVSSDTPDPDSTDNQTSATVTVAPPQADVRVQKQGPASVVAGETITWTVVATSYGPSDATGVVLTDTVPAGVTGIVATTSRGDPCTVSGQTVTCPVGRLPSAGAGLPGAAATVTITGTVAPQTTGTLHNTATATASTTDPDASNDTATSDTTVTTRYNLSVAKTANRTTLPGAVPRAVTYTITVTNDGPSAARDVTLSDLTPLVLTLGSATSPDGTCDTSQATTPQPGNPDHGLITCTLPGPIAPGTSAQVTVATQADQVLAGGPDVVETVSLQAADDTDPSDDSASWTLSGLPFVDLALDKSAAAQVTAGTSATYTFVLTNNNDPGSGTDNIVALRPILTDRLPPGVSYSSAIVTSGGGQDVACSVTGQDLTCQLTQDLPAGQSATVQVTVDIAPDLAAGTTLTNTAATVTADMTTNPDRNLANNSSTASSTVVAAADLAVTALTLDPVVATQTGPGSQRDVHLTLTNHGPSTAREVTFRIARTVDAFVVSTGTLPASCTSTARELVCTIAGSDLAPGESVDVDYRIAVAGHATPGSYPDTVQVSSTTPDSDPDNNTAVTPIVVGAAFTDLALTKTLVGTVTNPDDPHQAFVAGGAFAYQLTVQVPAAGYADAQNVVLDDLLPPGLVATAVASTAGTCTLDPAAGPGSDQSGLSCALGTVWGWEGTTARAATVVTVHGTLDPDAAHRNGGSPFAEQVENTAQVTTDTPMADDDANPSTPPKRTATAAVDIVELADLRLTKIPDQGTVVAGNPVGFTLTVTNAGPSDVEHVVVTDVLPVGFTLDAAASDCPAPQTAPQDETLAQPQVPAGPGQWIACRVGAVAAGQSVSIRIVATTDETLSPGPLTNTATVGSLTHEVDPSDNTTTADVTVQRLTNLAVASAASTSTPTAGQDITLTGFAVNNGPSTAVGTTGDTTFPPGFVPVSFDVPWNDCTWSRSTDPGTVVVPPTEPRSVPYDGSFSWVLHCEPMTPGAQWEAGGAATNVVVMHIPGDMPTGTYTGTSVIGSTTPETRLDDNTTTQTFVVGHVSNMSVTKTLVDPMQAGRPATWRLTVTNAGPSVADNVVVSDAVPPGMTFASAATRDGRSCPVPLLRDTEPIVECPMGSLEPGQSASALVTFDVSTRTVGDRLCNTALVGSGSLDPDATDNQSRACAAATAPTPTPPDETDPDPERTAPVVDGSTGPAGLAVTGPSATLLAAALLALAGGLCWRLAARRHAR
ncbi:MAG: hypothetical protein FWH11_12475 [Micrococcales bacterium]|nr:hypothetical protein [Micrococcales bacterium]